MKAKDFTLSVANHKLPYHPILENETYYYRSLRPYQNKQAEEIQHIFQKELNEIIKAYPTL